MMTIPFNVPYGTVAVYGTGVVRGMAGFIPNNTKYRFATIYAIGNIYDTDWQVGNSVMFRINDIENTECRLAIDNRVTFTILEQARLVLKEVIP